MIIDDKKRATPNFGDEPEAPIVPPIARLVSARRRKHPKPLPRLQ